MIRIEVIRTKDDGNQTEGVLFVVDTDTGEILFRCYTLELPYKNNQNNISCIPRGTYKCEKLPNSPSFGYDHIWIKNVPNRTFIKIHRANYVKQLRGCIAVGKTKADLNGDGLNDITNSAITLTEMMKYLPQTFEIEIS